MPCCSFRSIEYDPTKIRLRFAWLPLTDMNGEPFWLKQYWEYGARCDIGFFVLRGKRKQYSTKESFWRCINCRLRGLY